MPLLRVVASLLLVNMFVVTLPAAARVDIAKLQIDQTLTRSVQELVNRSSLIVVGWPDVAHDTYPTERRIGDFRLVNYVQRIQVKRVLKGTSPQILQLLTTGVEPLPDPTNPLNTKYSGPLAEGDYICFLQQVRGTEYYSLVGIWQGLYPIIDGRTVALEGSGYPSLNKLTVEQFAQKINTLMGSRSSAVPPGT
ncbi:hypothetical protein LOK74_01020 [Brevibacillus humidisoli]|uniref:hypothetical protein n=1 Tax=Brevibacillus humidisoli TaxID=2895522 RepID=UPI001E58CF44|nr:hypothetical protein [Brevibacillus humidisoli]UFJ41173.1 hypothetical protein LOK74_01020 [Brevibacillus humidisoli]